MGFYIPTRTFARLYLVQLSVCAFGLSSTLACDNFGLKNVNNDGGDWNFYNFTDSTDCILCFHRERGNSGHPELVLPCFARLLQPMKRKLQILYQFRRSGMPNPAHQDRVPLSVEGEEGRICQRDYISATNIDRTIHTIPRQRSDLGSEKTLVKDLDPMYSYRLKIQSSMGNFPPGSIVCLTNVTFNETGMPVAATTSRPPTTLDVEQPDQGSTLSRVGSSAVVPLKTEITSMKTRGDQRQSNFPIWVIFVIIAIMIISICAVAGVFICRRKHHDHQPANNVNTGRLNGLTNGMKENMKNDKVGISIPTNGHEPVNEKEEEYHAYTEIDVKMPGNIEMNYASAYESLAASSGTVYNCMSL